MLRGPDRVAAPGGEDPPAGCAGDGDFSFMDDVMVVVAQEDPQIDVCVPFVFRP